MSGSSGRRFPYDIIIISYNELNVKLVIFFYEIIIIITNTTNNNNNNNDNDSNEILLIYDNITEVLY